MRGRRSFTGFRIKAETIPVQICDPRTGELVGAVHARDEVYRTRRIHIGGNEEWLVVRGSKFGGLPLHASEGRRSWEQAWLDNRIEILMPRAGKWLPIEEWHEIARTRKH